MTALTFDALASEYESLLASCCLLPSRKAAATVTANKIIANRDRYKTVEAATTVPWFVIGVIHAMEAGSRFDKHLHNGDPLTARTRQVPRGRPKDGEPPFTWEESAIDALTFDGLDKVQDWTPARICFELERYNGFGYRRQHQSVLSPYLWSGTNHYTRGKYVADGKWDASAVSGQSGAIAILKCAMSDEEIAAALEPHEAPAPAEDHEPPAQAVTAKDLVGVSRKVTFLSKLRSLLATLGIGTGSMSAVDNFLNNGEQVNAVASFVKDHPLLVLAGSGAAICILGIVVASLVIKWTVEDHNSGNYIPSGDR